MTKGGNVGTWLVMAVTALLTGCVKPHWVIDRQAQPDPFAGARSFAVAPIDFTDVRVGDITEADYLSKKDADAQASWAGDKLALNDRYFEQMTAYARDSGITIVRDGAPFVLHPHVKWLEPGYYAVVAGAPSEARMAISITDANGKELDAIELHEGSPGSSLRTRFTGVGYMLGGTTAAYLKSRAFPK